MTFDIAEKDIEFKSEFFGKDLKKWAVFNGKEYNYEDVAMSDNGQINFWNESESFSVSSVYGEEDDNGNFPLIGYKVI